MSILRQQQIDEILDSENKLKRQIMERMQTQIKQFNEERKEKNMLQTANDVNIDGNIDKLLQILEKKNNVGESFLYSSFSYDNSNQKLLTELLSNQDIISLFNKTINLLNTSTMEENDKEALKLKILQIKPSIDTLSYIIFKIIRVFDDNDEHPRTGLGGFVLNYQGLRTFFQKFLPRLFTGYSLVRTIQKQLERNSYSPITVDEINTEFNQFMDDYRSEFGSTWIDDAPVTQVLNESIKNKSVEDAKDKRIKQMQQEMGGQPLSPEELRRISNIYLKTPLISSNLTQQELSAIADSIYGIAEQLRLQRENRITSGLPPEEIPDEIPLKEQEITGQPTEKSAETAKKEIDKITDSIYNNFIDGFKKVNFPTKGAWGLPTALLIEPLLLKITKDIIKYYLSTVNKAPVSDSAVDTQNKTQLNKYVQITNRIIDKTNNAPLTGVVKNDLKTELSQLKKDYLQIVKDANEINKENFISEFVKSREGTTNMQGEPFIFTGQGRPFLYNDENN